MRRDASSLFRLEMAASHRFHRRSSCCSHRPSAIREFLHLGLCRDEKRKPGRSYRARREERLDGRYGVEGDKPFELQRTRERQVHEFQSECLLLRPADRGALNGDRCELFW